MNMFHELMMRKKEQIMYATIKGSLTENDGVFSGFSSSNYLITQDYIDIDNTSNIEIVVKINKPSNKDQNMFIATDTNFGFVLRTTYSGYISCYVGNGNSFNIANGVTGTHILDNNKDYYVKIKIANGSFNVMISEDNQTYITDNTFDISSLTTTKQYLVNFGIGRTTSTYFTGSIDLNKSYIKIDNTKYKLQAVVGYTIVGSPTIVDGVVSGFGASDYLALPNYSGAYPSGKIAFTYERQSSMNQILLIIQSGSLFPFRIRTVDRTPQISWVDAENTQKNMLLSYSLVAGVYYSLSWEVKSGKIFFTLYDSLGNVLETKNQDISLEATTSGSAKIGWYSTTSYWQGSIDLNNTYIKDGNKLWFNGQQA